MKRSSDKAHDPHNIAKAVRRQVEAFLHTIPDVVDADFSVRIEALAATVTVWGLKMNLTAHPEDAEEIAFHVIDSLMPMVLASDPSSALFGQFERNREILDLGSGAGFPGLVLAAATPAHFTLVESRRKRASFLQVAAADMGLSNVTIEAKRAEQLDLECRYDLVTARAFGDPADFFAIAMRVLKRGGLAILYANPSQRFVPEAQRIPYRVARLDTCVDRILAIRRCA
ncbi:MAG TPA: 16S rRNA (guanine(527)-N(7))-methyltransferase RsmG [Candidatus Binataceae bacterium]|nr:16S rRNA (guanine(527)-N(7))-methyltransferase RsmG [Candidatus Binataceae bacterium]